METLVLVLSMSGLEEAVVPMTRICPGSSRMTWPPPLVVPARPEPATIRKEVERLSFSPPPMTTSPTSCCSFLGSTAPGSPTGRPAKGSAY